MQTEIPALSAFGGDLGKKSPPNLMGIASRDPHTFESAVADSNWDCCEEFAFILVKIANGYSHLIV